jgi:hypothetical protein
MKDKYDSSMKMFMPQATPQQLVLKVYTLSHEIENYICVT